MDAARRATSWVIFLRGAPPSPLGGPRLPLLNSHLLTLRCCVGVFYDRGTGNGRCGMVHQVGPAFTRFVPPERPEETAGAWRRYYEHWRHMTSDRLNPRLIELVPPLAALAPPDL